MNPATPAGNVAVISHNGSIWEAILQNRRGVAFNSIVSSGNEMVTTTADYMQFALADESTRAIGLFVEAVRDPETFIAALAEAADRDVPVVALKTGRTERGRAPREGPQRCSVRRGRRPRRHLRGVRRAARHVG